MSGSLDFLKDVKRPQREGIPDAPRDPVTTPIRQEVYIRPPAKSAKGSGFQRTTVYLPQDLYQTVKQRAYREGRELSDIVAELLDAWVH
jgi:hypothetical protein